jgi:hypothetical protein
MGKTYENREKQRKQRKTWKQGERTKPKGKHVNDVAGISGGCHRWKTFEWRLGFPFSLLLDKTKTKKKQRDAYHSLKK